MNCASTRPWEATGKLRRSQDSALRFQGPGWRVPVSIRAVSARRSDAEDKEARRLLGPGYVLDDDAEAWVAVMENLQGDLRVASSFLPLADVRRLLRRGLDDVGRRIQPDGF